MVKMAERPLDHFSPGEAPGIEDQTSGSLQPGAEAAGRHDGQPNAARWQRLEERWSESAVI